ncbi:hypothetical protein BJY01DRAFT_242912 [Aspergillus pseudoustus]|uniref:Uncharacterized protein n=1 Tax=Aspergillus pseudoustus TaxID=1810923 RepID=A0ABR4KXL1_9EURO
MLIAIGGSLPAKMNTDTKSPYPPPQLHTTPAAAPAPPYEYEYSTTHHADNNSLEMQQPPKTQLRTMQDVKREWRHGSKSRVFKYYLVYALIGFVTGAIIGVIIGVIIRFA